ncbi:ArsR family transcriptional regulator [Amycolatopsis sp. cg5]|uniref:ArsR/SmtB family transcription factor n=1 Tax=Amycolatopsis sp. cg5 TaxID=3238802 RepID=UPI00352619A4
MSLRIHFSGADLARVTLAETPDPLWELLLSLHAVQGPVDHPLFGRWSAEISLTSQVRELCRIAPARGYSPDFLTPGESARGLDAGLEAVLTTPVPRLRSELSLLDGPAWANALGEPRSTTLRDLVGGLADYHRTAVQPHWTQIEKQVGGDRAARARILLNGGVEALLGGLHPALRWQAPVLELRGDHVQGDLHLNGRGLRLVPAFFCEGAPTLLADPGLPPVLVYPIAHDPAWLAPAGAGGSSLDWAALAALLGPTRAQVLCAAATGCNTTQLSKEAGISLASASYHASILREAGLLETHRAGTAVKHTLSPLGRDLLARQTSLGQSSVA